MKESILVVRNNSIKMKEFIKILKNKYELYIVEGYNDIDKKIINNISIIIVGCGADKDKDLKFLKGIRNDNKLRFIPIIGVTNEYNREVEANMYENGLTDCVYEGSDPYVLIHKVFIMCYLSQSISGNKEFNTKSTISSYTKERFCKNVQNILDKNPDKDYEIIYSDIDNFKMINSMLGDNIGDVVLRKLSDNYIAAVDEDELAARIGEDDFVALVKNKGSFLAEFLKNIATLEDNDEHYLKNIDIKFGVYEITDRSTSVSTMFDRTLMALRTIKNKYGVLYQIYNEEIYDQLSREQFILNSMDSAIKNNEFEVYFQPKYDPETNKMSGAEALVRWNNPLKGMIPPNEFIPIFEKNGFISKLDIYVWEKTCECIKFWKDRGRKLVPISVNVSRMDFYQIDIIETITNILKKYDVDYKYLHLEITESAYTENPRQIIETVTYLRDLGLVIEMDDFGTGYSSLNMLNELPIDILKLDASFIRKDLADNNSRNILNFIITLAKYLDLEVVAEGVETQEQVDRLKGMECNLLQGYYYAKPMQAINFEQYLIE